MGTPTASLALLLALSIPAGLGYAREWTEEEKQILRVLDEWQRAFDNNDYDTLERVLTEDVEMHSRYLNAVFKDRKSFLDALKKKKALDKTLMTSARTTVTEIKIKISSERAEVLRTFETEVRNPGGRGPTRSTLTKEMRLRKEDGVWRISYER